MSNQSLILLLSLIPLGAAAWQDMRTRHVSNWITIPLFFAAWPLAWRLQGWMGVIVVAAVFLATYLAMPYGFGPADGKLAVFLAAVGGAPAVLLALGLNGLLFLLARLFPKQAGQSPFVHVEEDGVHVAAAFGFFLGVSIAAIVSF